MPDFRYAQFCPLARAAEIVGERWTLLVVRELLLGPKRFSDLQAALSGVSTSVLSERLSQLEKRGLIGQRELPPPAASTVYELTADGAALEPVILELARWGMRFQIGRQPGDHFEPDWIRLGIKIFARRRRSPARRLALTVRADGKEATFHLVGGREGTAVLVDEPPGVEARLTTEPTTLMGLVSRQLTLDQALATGAVQAEGDLDAVRQLPDLFDL